MMLNLGEIKRSESCVVTLSGGADSTTMLYLAKSQFKEVIALSFNYGQRHSEELERAKKIAKDAGVEHHILDVSVLNQIVSCALTKKDIDVPHFSEVKDGVEPVTVVRGRNMFFGVLTSIFASERGIKNIMLGICQTDASNYIDTRDIFAKGLNVAVNLGIDSDITVYTPLMWMNKMESTKLAYDLGILDIIINDTLTCYNGNISKEGCKECPSCQLRNKGFKEFGEKYGVDMYETYGIRL